MKKLTEKEKAERYEKAREKARAYYEKNKVARAAYQRQRYREMREALKQVKQQ